MALVAALVAAIALVVSLVRSPEVPASEFGDLYAAGDPVASVALPNGTYFGAALEGSVSNPAPLRAFSRAAGADPSMLMLFQSWYEPIDVQDLERVAARGRLPILSWEPWNFELPDTNPFPLQDIAAGEFDDYIRAEARALAAVDSVVALRLAHEMNGDWYPWGVGVHGNRPADYVAMYRHVHDLFEEEGADNVLWVWSPNMVEPATQTPLDSFFPGRAYVDWVGVVGYLTSEDRWYGFEKVYADTFAALNVFAPELPIIVTEISVAPQDDPDVRPHLVADMFAGMAATPRLVGFVWFNLDKSDEGRSDWRLEVDQEAASAFRSGIDTPGFLTGPVPGLTGATP